MATYCPAVMPAFILKYSCVFSVSCKTWDRLPKRSSSLKRCPAACKNISNSLLIKPNWWTFKQQNQCLRGVCWEESNSNLWYFIFMVQKSSYVYFKYSLNVLNNLFCFWLRIFSEIIDFCFFPPRLLLESVLQRTKWEPAFHRPSSSIWCLLKWTFACVCTNPNTVTISQPPRNIIKHP